MSGDGSQGGSGGSADPLSALRVAVEATAERDPDRVALTDGAGSRSYGELARLLEQAGRRRRSGRRALAVGRSLADVETILSEACAGNGLLLVDAGATAWEAERAEALFAEADREELVLGLCSSGSSGLPKVVELEWESLLRNAGSFAAAAGYGEADVLWCTTPLAHLYCFGAGVLGGLLSGATVLLGKGMLEPAEFAELARAEAPTLLLSVPFLFRRYLETLRGDPEILRRWGGRLRGAIAAGEPVPPRLIAAWRELTGVPLRSHYGLTEGGQITLAGGGEEEGVGPPLDDVELRIGKGGEVAVRRRPPARPHRVIGAEPAADGWYETGDLGHLDEAGNLHVTGRADSRINVAGKKVDPAEVEDALSKCEGVEDCAVAGVEGSAGIEVVAFVRVDSAAEIGDAGLRKQLAARLSPHKLPRRFVRVEEVPRTLTGKVRRGELIAGLAQSAAPEQGRDASVLELVRREAAGVVLGHHSAGAIEPDLSFKELGFDSLAAVSLCEALARATGLRVQATAVFDHPTPAALAAHLEALAGGGAEWARAARPAGFIGEPVAIVGMACRYPGGADSPQRLWELVAAGTDAISGFPADRGWDLEGLYDPDPDRLGTSYAREGGFLAGADRFDAEFFGISPREALAMDPQQRLLLEATWEALEDAGIDPGSCRGTATAVFAGVMTRDYAAGSLPESTEGYLTTGLAESVVSGRVAYSLGLEGPAVTVNTACSSSLVAMHLACQSLRLDECSLALAGGVSVMATPAQFVEFSRQRGLAPDGRCKSFAAAADGTAWSEGVGLLVLERLSEARRNGHRVLATIRGSAINQDGASNGLTAPNGPSQERVIRQALANAGLEPGEVDAVEAHGTGTTLGDPIEAGALLATYGQERERPLKLGSIKSNIGHSLAGAGVAGTIKMVQAIRQGVLPKTLHVDEPSPHVDWGAGKVELLTEAERWETDGRPRRAAVSSFGISGTNAHLILEQAPPEEGGEAADGEVEGRGVEPIPWLLSAKGEAALRAQAERLLAHLRERPELDPLDVGFSLATARAQLSDRAVLLGDDREELLDSLAALASGEASPRTYMGQAQAGKTAFLFTGQGAQRAGMGAELYRDFPVFAAALDALCAELDPELGRSLKELLFAAPDSPEAVLLDQTRFTQPALFAIEVALFRLLESRGLRPDLLAGHSVGELSAAHVAGVLSLPDACKLVAARGRLMGELAEGGAMVAIGAAEADVREALAGFEQSLSVAAINGPESTVVSGEEEEALRLAERFRERGKKTSRLRVSHAFHSQRMEPMLEQLAEVAGGLELAAPRIPIVSDVTGELLGAEQATSPEYWARQAREPVRFLDAARTLAAEGATRFLELGPDGVLSAALDDCLDEEAATLVAPLLRKDRPEPETLTAALATAHANGIEIDWETFFAGSGAKAVELPTYAFQRKRYWIDSSAGSGDPAGAGQAASAHPLLGAAIEDPTGEGATFTGRLSLSTHPWLKDHAVGGTVLLPGAAVVDLALSVGAELGAEALEELTGEAALVLPETGAVQIQLLVGAADEEGRRSLQLHSRPEGDPEAEWARNASGTLAAASPAAGEGLSAWPPPGAEPIAVGGLYEDLAEAGFAYGPAFQGLRAAWRQGEELFAEVELDEQDRSGAFAIHPALLDSALHLGFLADSGAEARLPFAWSGVSLRGGPSSLRVRLTPAGDDGFALLGTDASGAPVVSIEKLTLRPLDPGSLPSARGAGADSLFRLLWQELPLPQAAGAAAEPWHCEPEPAADPVAAAEASAERVLAELQRRLGEEDEQAPRLALITHGAVAAAEGESPDLASAPLWGLLRAAQAEHPGRFCLIDSDGSEASGAALEAALGLEGEPQLALREGRVLAPRLGRLGPGIAEDRRSPDPDATTLITGASGTLGAIVARHMVEAHGVRHLVLVSRRGAEAPGAETLKAELEEQGASVRVAACDVADRDQLAALLDSIPAERPLQSVIHAAGVLDDGILESQSPERLQKVFAPKARGAWNLHELTREMELSQFVLFSSVAGTLGSPGQANYAAANAFLDALATSRQAEGLAGTSIAWGLWATESAMSGELGEADLARMRRGGMAPIADAQGLELFDAALASGEPASLAAPLESATLRAQARAGELAPVFSGLVRQPTRRQAPGASLAQRLAGVPEAEREAVVVELVRSEAATVLGHPVPAAIDPGRAFKELGFDSLAAVELRNRLRAITGLRLPSTLVFDHPSVAAVASYLQEQVGDAGQGAAAAAVRAVASEEPIAIVGMACRYPGGVESPRDLWSLVAAEGDGIGGFPEDRGWHPEILYDPDPDAPGRSYSREGGFLDSPGDFDPAFFGIGPREALATDPQQRLLLEASWDALENARLDPLSLRGAPVGVFAGVMHHDYGNLAGSAPDLEAYIGTGTAGSVVSGRVAYQLGLEGPAITVDTACSSSLVAMHLAAQALRGGECSLALAGGATVLARPNVFIEFSRQRGLAPDGRCKSFAEAADGVGWGEGVGVLVLERLSEARRNGHPVLATIRGSAVNQDGASNGLTAPNGPSQERVIRQALANAGLSPQDIDMVEAHGTGTTLGDPIEAGALLATYGQDRERPLKLGSVKSNIGHAQAAAGVAGVIKTVMAMREGILPKTLHVDSPSSKVEWEAGQVELLREAEPWEANGHPRRAGVSSFGISGTNAHLILEEAPARDEDESRESAKPLPGPIPLALSAKSQDALQAQAARLAAHLQDNPGLKLADVAYSLATTRAALERRAVVLAGEREETLGALDALGLGELPPDARLGEAKQGAKLAYLFSGQGSQRVGMGKELHETYPAYADAFDQVCELFDRELEVPLAEVLFATHPKAKELLNHTSYTQPALFATELALYRLLESQGLKPDLLCGHSVGELLAAHLAGVFDLKDATRLVAARGRLMGELPGGGAMVAIEAGEAELKETLAGKDRELSIAAINGPGSLVLSGTGEAIEAAQAHWEEQGRKTKRLAVSHAFHSPLIEPMLEEFEQVARSLHYSEPEIPIVSNLSGELLGAEQAGDPAYWVAHVREPVRFMEGVHSLLAAGATAFLELGPDPVLIAMAAECLAEQDETPAVFAPALRKDRPEPETLTAALATAHANGIEIDWETFFAGTAAKAVDLPTYAFQRRRYWIEPGTGADPAGAGQAAAAHPLLGAEVQLAASGERLFTGRLSLATHPWLADHAVGGTVLLPGAAFVDLALSIGAELGTETLEELIGEAALALPETGAVQIQLGVGAPDEEGRRSLQLHSRPEGDSEAEWTRNAGGTLAPSSPISAEDLAAWPPPGAEPVALGSLYEDLAEAGFAYGPAFQGLRAAWRRGEELFAEVDLGDQRPGAFAIHPALLDSALHLGFLAGPEAEARLPFAWSGVSLHGSPESLRVRLTPAGEDGFALLGADAGGTPVLSIEKLVLRPFEPGSLPSSSSSDSLLRLLWQEVPLPEATGPSAEPWHCEPEPAEDPVAAAQAAAGRVLAELQRRLGEEDEQPARLALITRGAVAATEGESPDLAAAPLWGLLRSAQAEHPGRFALIDSDGSEASAAALVAALALEDEPQLAIREGRVLAPRLGRVEGSAARALATGEPWHLDAVERGTLENLALVAAPGASAPLGPTGVRVAVGAAGLNFRDVLIALGSYPGEALIGSEGAGAVVEVGAQVSDLSAGDRVFGLIDNAFGPLAIAERRSLERLPAGWSAAEGAAVPLAAMTALYGLVDLASLQAGERVLIHAAAGGVGGFAVRLAQHLGAEVFATASPAKWDALREAGIDDDHIASSRELGFKDKFLAASGGEGVDVVLDSLAGEFVDASLELLPGGGRFLEMGKADIRDPERVAASHPGVAYRAYDLAEAGPERTEAMLEEIVALFARGALRMPPVRGWDVRRGADAFRFMSQGRHTGKIVLSIPQAPSPTATTLITGATGTLGALIARHLVKEHGARNLILAGRRGDKAPGIGELAAELEEQGASVRIAACDVADRDQLAALLDSIPAERPLQSVIHAAGVLDDGILASLNPERLQRVLAPKARGAWNLHELTREMELSQFVLFSSVAATLGSPGQANYAAANAFLDALATSRQAEGLAGTSIAWGLWATESAMSGELGEADLARMRRGGMAPIADAQGLELFDAALASGEPFGLAAAIELPALRSRARAGELPAIFSALVGKGTRRPATGASLAQRLAGLAGEEREAAVLELVRAEAATVLGHPSPAAIDPGRAFKELGFDSLAAVELRNRLKAITGLRLASTLVFDHPSVAAVASHLCELAGDTGRRTASAVRGVASEEPIAIVGMACRYPGGVESPRDLWSLVAAGGDGIGGFPEDRGWDLERLYDPDPDAAGTSYAREGGFLAGADRFDAEFFGIGPREALATDPQQRLLLEASWEALEQAGIDPSALRGEPAGVFSGISSSDYGPTLRHAQELEGHTGTGNLGSVLSGRIAYALGLEGPAITVDTACSSSLVAMHLAAGSLRGGECSLALAGGVTVLSTPESFIGFSRQRGLSPDGRCKSFAEAADGTGFSEGAGLLVLERLSEARRNGHPVLATIRGSAVNQDGASNGLTAPNGPSQERVIRQALANAGLSPQDIDMVEAHGTGTTLGDPIEAGALLATYGQDRERPLKLGSVKSNIGHAQAAAGVAGVIKTVMAMREGILPKTLHVDSPSSKVEWEAGQVELLREAEPWEANGHPRRAGVSSFGISGTNAHLILEEAPARDEDESRESAKPLPGPIPLALSAKSQDALQAQAARLAAHLQDNPGLKLADVAYSLATTRAALERRAVVLAGEREETLGALDALGLGELPPDARLGEAKQGAKLAYLFSGQGSQRVGMGKELHETYPAYADAFDQVCELFDRELEVPLAEVLFATHPKAKELLNHTSYTQPALFATELALYRLLESQGLKPDLLCGHSVGELLAAHLAGVFDLKDATRLVAARGRLMGELPGGGAMVAIEAGEAELKETLAGKDRELSIAAINGPGSLVLSGTGEAIEAAQAHWEEQGRKTKRLAVSHAFHSPLIEPMLEEFEQVARSLHYSEPEIPIVSNLSGELLGAEQAGDPAYWVAHVREPVRFMEGVHSLLAAGATAFLELGPDPVLIAMAAECLAEQDETPAVFAPALRKDRPEPETLTAALATAHANGIEIDWETFFAGTAAKAVDLPTYAFQRRRYWIEPGTGADPAGAGQAAAAHPLLGAEVQLAASGERLFTGRLSLATHPWLADHAVGGTVLLPGAAFVDLALSIGAELGTETLEELIGEAALALPETGAVQIQLGVGAPDEEGRRSLQLHSRPEGDSEAEWTRNAGGTLAPSSPISAEDLAAWPPPGAEPVALGSLYEDLAEAGFAYGPAFQGLRAAWRRGEELFAEVDLGDQRPGAFAIHPALLDSALHLGFLAGPEAEARLPFAWSGVSLHGSPESLRVRLTPAGEDGFALLGADAGGTPVLSIEKLVLRPFEPGSLPSSSSSDSLLRLLWQEVPLPEATGPSAEPWHCEPEPAEDPVAAAQAAAGRVLAELQRRLGEEDEQPARLALITRGAVAATEGESPDLAAAPLWGLLRSAQAEHPGRFALIDSDGSEASAAALVAALALEDEPQLAIREGRVLAPRLGRVEGSAARALATGEPWHLDAVERGTLENLALVAAPGASAPLGPTGVRVAVGAAGLNFRDVLIALGSYPGEALIGSEGAGAVVEVGAQVSDLSAGDRVFGLIDNAFGPLAIAERRSLERLPAGWSAAEGAAVPLAAMTALYGLVDLASLQAGERVLIHAAAGGVGGFAVRLAQHLGAEVFATASPAKWDALREAGIDDDHIASSRELGFKDKFLAASGGEGVDVVLDSLAGEFVDASLELLPGGGRFLEMGKADIRDPERVAASHPGVAYRAYDLAEAGPERTEAMLEEIVALFARGALRMPPVRGWDVRRGADAFRFMSQGRHTGKIVLSIPQAPSPTATTLITGATGTLGALIARHLVKEHGARNLILAGRRGDKAPGIGELAAELEEQGASVRIAACDVADRDQLAALLDSIPAERPLQSVIHAAGVLDDGILASLNPERLQRVLAPKARGAWNLHELTREMELSQFVLFSSVAATLGSPGQANYAAANAFLDALATSRQAEGLAGTSIAWGLWATESAMSGELGEADLARMRRGGMAPIADAQGLELFDAALASGEPFGLAAAIELPALRSRARAGELPAIFSALVGKGTRRPATGASLAQRLAGLAGEEREAAVLELVRAEAATVLGHPSPAAIDPGRAFKELGFDSLAAVELRNRLKAITGLRLASTLVFDHPSPEALAMFLLGEASDGGAAPPPGNSELDRLEALFASTADDERMDLLVRLRSLVSRVSLDSDTDADDQAPDLESASDDEVIELIEEEFGSA